MKWSIPMPTGYEWLFSAKTTAAALLALYISFAAGLDRPYWAMAAVFIVANQLSGATRSKAVYRVAGTVIGATGAVTLLSMFNNMPVIFCIALSLWTGTLLFISLLDHTPRSYTFLLAGYTLPIVALPNVGDANGVFMFAVSRVQEITVGILCAALVNVLVFPIGIGSFLHQRVVGWMKSAGTWASQVLAGEPLDPMSPECRTFATDLRSLDTLIPQLSFDSTVRRTTRQARELRGRLTIMLPLLVSVADRLAAVRSDGVHTDRINAITDAVAAWIAEPGSDAGQAASLRARIAQNMPQTSEPLRWSDLLLTSALERLDELVAVWQDCRTIRDMLPLGDNAPKFRPLMTRRNVTGGIHYHDYFVIAVSASLVVAATLIACFLWLATGWTNGAGCVIMAAVCCSFFAGIDNPAPLMKVTTFALIVAIVVAGIGIFGILPLVTDFLGLAIVLSVPFLLLSTMVNRPQFALIALMTAINSATILGIQQSYSADFVTFANTNVASVLGGVLGTVCAMLTRPFMASFVARRLVRANWTDLMETARGGLNRAPDRFANRFLDRLNQLLPRLAAGAAADIATRDIFTDLRVGLNVLDLQRARIALPPDSVHPVDTVLDGVAATYAGFSAAGHDGDAPQSLRDHIDDALCALAGLTVTTPATMAQQALVGLRRALFPQAPAPQLSTNAAIAAAAE